MSYTRSSPLIKLGRAFQGGYKYLSFLDHLVKLPLSVRKKRTVPVLCIVAPPRSGSTLTYQLLTNQINNFHLTNIWNLLYATPAIGMLISKMMCSNYQSMFRSNNGFVTGVCGESEGMKFWTHWCGQGLEENIEDLHAERLPSLYATLQMIGQREVFITGYIGHVFCMQLLRRAFPKIIFVHVTRDLLSNAYSVLQRSNNGWFSLKPKQLLGKHFSSSHEQVIEQIICIHKAVLRASKSSDTIRIQYGEICSDPEKVIHKIVSFSKKQSIDLDITSYCVGSFREKKVTNNTNSDTVLLQNLINKRILRESEDLAFFRALQ